MQIYLWFYANSFMGWRAKKLDDNWRVLVIWEAKEFSRPCALSKVAKQFKAADIYRQRRG